MLKKILLGLLFGFILLITIGMIAAPEKTPESQELYTQQLNEYRDLMKEVKDGQNGYQIKTAEESFKLFINEPRTADLWYARVESISEHEGIVYIKAQYEDNQHDSYIDYSQIFTLIIQNPETKKKVINLQKGDDIFFSGYLGEETSITFNGSLEQPEYRFSPTKIKLSLNADVINIQ
ncbi:hypothetical protein PVK64_02085 [Aliivibrio sp. S4TY2]|uniref:hypothetical protein n=1 Tax=unclassified Aliivibrio TaxID=2645654 RepID=UPI00237989E2|nr:MULTISPECIES: hypothetical protein [unclassified Aliivibrio]MDD9154982.1 hypothetical protein [Aliivibrio sp. S4TY2]MDD9158655.1 hypothetical protein [Aliivibrio sp. S4TY1]